jgi:hypothetical protein
VGGLVVHIFSQVAIERFEQIHKIDVEHNFLCQPLSLIEIGLAHWQQWWPKWHLLLPAGSHNIQTCQ